MRRSGGRLVSQATVPRIDGCGKPIVWAVARCRQRILSGGAAVTQAAMFVQRMREIFPAVPVTESHPKVLLSVLAHGDWDAFADRFGLNKATGAGDDMRDALIAAVSAREGFQGRWSNDLSLNRLASEQDPSSYWLAPVHYYWPAR